MYENIKTNCSLLFFSIMWYIQCFVLVKNTFELNQTTGQLYCVKQLDRENIDQYIFYIRAVTSSNRRKRSFGGMLNIFFPVVYVLINMGVLKESTNLFLSGLICNINLYILYFWIKEVRNLIQLLGITCTSILHIIKLRNNKRKRRKVWMT